MAIGNLTKRTDTATGGRYHGGGGTTLDETALKKPSYYDVNLTAARGSQTFNPGTKPYTPPNDNANAITGGVATGSNGVYESTPSNIESLLKSAYEAQQSQLNTAYNLGRDNLERQRADALRDAEINDRVYMNRLPQLLRSNGVSGGGAESTLMGLRTAYQNQVSGIEKAIADALAELELRRANTATNNFTNYQTNLADYLTKVY